MAKVSIPDRLICAITHELPKDPVSIKGDTTPRIYERSAIERHFEKNDTNPVTNATVESRKVVPNSFARDEINEFLAKICTKEAFFKAVSSGKLEELSQLNYLDEHLEARDKEGNTALHIAAEKGFEAIVELLIKESIDINPQNKKEKTPIQLATQRGHINVVKRFLAKNKNLLQAQTPDKETLLHFAAESGNPDLVKLLIAEKLECDAQRNHHFSQTPLCIASNQGYEPIVQLLVKEKVDIKKPLVLAASGGYVDIVNLLLSTNVDVSDFEGRETPLHAAAAAGHESLVRIFLEKYPNWLLAKFNGHETPLEFAARRHHENVVKILLERYQELKIDCEFSALHAAIRGRDSLSGKKDPKAYEGTINLIITKYSHLLQAQDVHGLTALHVAALRDENILRLLLKEKVDLDAQNREGDTALHLAAEKGNAEGVRLLLEKGANDEIRNNEGYTPAQVSKGKEITQIFQIYPQEILRRAPKRIANLEQEIKDLNEKLENLMSLVANIEKSANKTNPNFASRISSSSNLMDDLINFDDEQNTIKPSNN